MTDMPMPSLAASSPEPPEFVSNTIYPWPPLLQDPWGSAPSSSFVRSGGGCYTYDGRTGLEPDVLSLPCPFSPCPPFLLSREEKGRRLGESRVQWKHKQLKRLLMLPERLQVHCLGGGCQGPRCHPGNHGKASRRAGCPDVCWGQGLKVVGALDVPALLGREGGGRKDGAPGRGQAEGDKG